MWVCGCGGSGVTHGEILVAQSSLSPLLLSCLVNQLLTSLVRRLLFFCESALGTKYGVVFIVLPIGPFAYLLFSFQIRCIEQKKKPKEKYTCWTRFAAGLTERLFFFLLLSFMMGGHVVEVRSNNDQRKMTKRCFAHANPRTKSYSTLSLPPGTCWTITFKVRKEEREWIFQMEERKGRKRNEGVCFVLVIVPWTCFLLAQLYLVISVVIFDPWVFY